jgi:hypothetical protein
MNVATLWIKRKDFEDDAPELVVAWDEYCIEENWTGWRDNCARVLADIGDQVAAFRFINIQIASEEIQRYFEVGSATALGTSELEDPRAL